MIKKRTIKVLLVDADAIDREVCIRYLSQIHTVRYQVSEVDSVHDALDCCRAGICDVVVADYFLPDGTGLDLLKNMSEVRGGPRVPVIMLAGMGSEKLAVDSIKAGAKNYLPKDKISPRALHEAIEEAVSSGSNGEVSVVSGGVREEAHCEIPPRNWIRI